MDRRAFPGLLGALDGCALGVTGAMTTSPILPVVPAACALLAGASSLAMLDRAGRAERRLMAVEAELAALQKRHATPVRPEETVLDPETGLPDGRFFEIVLASRISTARRHLWPVTIVLLEFTPPGQHRFGDAVLTFARTMSQVLREADLICRLGPRSFALILEDTNETGAVWATEHLQAALSDELAGGASLAAGVASYPTHGLQTADVLVRARGALLRAVAADVGQGQGPVEVAVVDLT